MATKKKVEKKISPKKIDKVKKIEKIIPKEIILEETFIPGVCCITIFGKGSASFYTKLKELGYMYKVFEIDGIFPHKDNVLIYVDLTGSVKLMRYVKESGKRMIGKLTSETSKVEFAKSCLTFDTHDSFEDNVIFHIHRLLGE